MKSVQDEDEETNSQLLLEEKSINLKIISSSEGSESSKIETRPSNESFRCSTKLWLGILCIIVNNILIIGFNYVLKTTKVLRAAEVVLFMGPLQIIIFLIIGFVRKCSWKVNGLWNKIAILGLGVSLGIFIPFALLSVVMIPLGDWVILVFSSPIPALILSRLILKQPLNPVKIGSCFSIILGVILVVRPPFLFGYKTDKFKDYPHYWLGVFMCLTSAFCTGFNNVVVAKLHRQKVSMELMLVVMGVGSVVLTPLLLLVIPGDPASINRIFYDPGSISGLTWFYYVGVGTMSALGTLLIAAANTLAPPVIVSMVRTTQILLVIVMDIYLLGIYPTVYSAVGSVMVISAVMAMSTSDLIVTFFVERFGDANTG